MNDDSTVIGAALIGFAIGITVALYSIDGNVEPCTTIIEQGCGYYHQQTGEFTWRGKKDD